MAKRILKNTNYETIVKIDGAGIETITLAELALANQEVNTPLVNIVSIVSTALTTGDKITITRNAEELYTIPGGRIHYIDLKGMFNTVDNTNNDTDIVVNLTGDGYCILMLRKQSGYNNKIQLEQNSIYDDPTTTGS